MSPNEESPLLPSSSCSDDAQKIGFNRVFLAAADESIVLSTWSIIASQFRSLSRGSWLLVAYNFGYCVSLPVYGVLCELYGRKNVLLGSYALFAVGSFACGISNSLVQLVLARVVAGISGGGMVSLVSIIITDLSPVDDVALLRSYANVVNIAGRSLGPPLGGFLIDAIGWRSMFLGQLPLIIICLVIGLYGFPSSLNVKRENYEADPECTSQSTFSHLDFSGLASFSVATVLLLCLTQSWSATSNIAPAQMTMFGLAFAAASIAFVAVEAFWARNPLIPLRLMKTSLGGYCINQMLMMSSRSGLLSNLSPYLIRTENATDSYTSSTFTLAAVGVSIGGLMAGALIKRWKRYKAITAIAICGAFMSYLLIFVRWRNGLSRWEILYLFPAGLFVGILFTSQFVGMALCVPRDDLAICITTYYLCQQLGNIIGPAANVTVVQRVFEGRMKTALAGWKEQSYIGPILNNARFAQNLPISAQRIVRQSYLDAFQFVPLISAVCSLIMLPIVLWLKEESID
ncbi:major facilitator superfamily domain-containing protein [Aspergillus avenaceus]|uniref:Major facilitator superfamily domain-containing protein n=1 Tax=Aspergillus avenaceus TaxID=36643 RepID=A0A5N6U2M3_ASPAV|nr:major facilitator superfamily domain-containing protein [Aspergillus avenaceus]